MNILYIDSNSKYKITNIEYINSIEEEELNLIGLNINSIITKNNVKINKNNIIIIFNNENIFIPNSIAKRIEVTKHE